MIGNYMGSDVRMMIGGKEIGKMESLKVEPGVYSREETMRPFGLPNSAAIGVSGATVNMDLLKSMFGYEPEPKFDIKMKEYKKVLPLPNGRVALPKKRRIRKKWLKRYYRVEETTYYGCTLNHASEGGHDDA